MARPSADKIQEELDKQDATFGEDVIGEDDAVDIDEARKKTTGEAPEDGESLDIVRKIGEDEASLVRDDSNEEQEEESEEIPGGFHVEEPDSTD